MALSTTLQCAPFCDSQRAERGLERLRSLLPPELISSLPVMLAECPDPVQALNLLERLRVAGGKELARLLGENRVLLQHVLAIFGQSHWLGETILKNPGPDLVDILGGKTLERSFECVDFRQDLEKFRSNCAHVELSTLLAGFKKREYVRIALRDILGMSTLAEATGELSYLTDVILEHALQEAQSQSCNRFVSAFETSGNDMAQFSVIALGKLGGNELNYSSDLDLLYLYRDEDMPHSVARREYFVRQSQLLTQILCRPTPEGAVFRIDLRLRPQGREGEIAVGLRRALEYYGNAAHDWELQALIKARHCAGDQNLSLEFIKGVQPRVYTRKVNFAAIETALRSRERMGQDRWRRLRSTSTGCIDVKLDRGGIRDIEFLVQGLQRIYGGEEIWLRSGGTLFSFQKLHDKGHISGKDFQELTLAYEFLRTVEHRLQLQKGQQLHRVPAEAEALSVLARSMPSRAGIDGPTKLHEKLLAHMRRVSEIYRRVIFSHKRREKRVIGGALAPSPSSVREVSFEQMLEPIAQDSPALHELTSRAYPIHTRRNLHRFLSSAMTSAERYAALLENPAAVEKAIPLFAFSDYLSDILVRHPDVIRALDAIPVAEAAPAPNAPWEMLATAADADNRLSSLDGLRRSFRRSSFAIGARDVLALRPAFQSMAESSALADTAISRALQIINGHDTLAVFALGRLGTNEFDIASDADLLFVREADDDAELARTAAEKLVHALGSYTRQGSIFAVDARLRPYGNEGELVITPAQLDRYLADEARPWEALTYTKLRFVAGREDLSTLTLPPVWDRIIEMAFRPDFGQSVIEMRARIENSNRYPHSFKLARGGFYDIDFIISFLMLRGGSLGPANALERLQHLHRAGSLDQPAFQQLREATLLYRTTDHVIRLVTGRARPELPAAEYARQATETLVSKTLERDRSAELQHALDMTKGSIRALFQQIFAT